MKRALTYVLLTLGLFVSFSTSVHASSSDNLMGYAWSSNVGWISFNCTNVAGECTNSNYGVNVNTNGWLTGYAWSSNVGWVKFGGIATSSFPTGSGTYTQNAQVVSGGLRGWAQVLSADGNGWDGFISLAGSGPSYQVTVSGSNYTGYAWGSDVVGWVDFAGDGPNGVRLSGDASLDITSGGLSIVGNGAVTYNSIPTFVWTITNLPSTSCAVTKTAGGSPFSTPITGKTASGNTVEDALSVAGLHTYSLDCTSPTISKQYSFTVAPQAPSFSISPLNDTAKIQILASGTSDSETKNIFVTAVGGFNAPVTVAISGFPTAPASTTFTYSLGGGAFSASPAPVILTSPYAVGTTFKMRVSRQAGAPAFSGSYPVSITGTSPTYPSSPKTITITPVIYDPVFKEY